MVLFIEGHFYAGMSPPAEPAPPNAPIPTGRQQGIHRSAHTEMAHAVKLALAFLVIAILLTDLADKALTNHTKDWLNLAGECFTVLLGLGYAMVIQWVTTPPEAG